MALIHCHMSRWLMPNRAATCADGRIFFFFRTNCLRWPPPGAKVFDAADEVASNRCSFTERVMIYAMTSFQLESRFRLH